MFNGNSNTSTSLFGSLNTSTPTSTPAPAANNFQLPQKSGSMFGNVNNNIGASTPSPSTGLFGNKTSALGSTQQNTNNPTAGGGLFAKPATSTIGGATASNSLFGNNNNSTNAGGLFGNSTTASQPGNAGGLFGNSNNNAQCTTTTSLFGAKPATSGLLGSNPVQPATTSLFGNNTSSTTGGSLFTAKPATTGTSLFTTTQQPATQSTGFFNNNQNSQLNNNNNNLSVSANPYGLNIGSLTATTMPKPLTPLSSNEKSGSTDISNSNLRYKKRMSSVSSTMSQNVLTASTPSTLISKLSNRLKSNQNVSSLNGIFSPTPKNSWFNSDPSRASSNITDNYSKTSLADSKNIFASSSLGNIFSDKRNVVSDIKKLKIDPERSAAKKLKLLSGKSIITKENESTLDNVPKKTLINFSNNTVDPQNDIAASNGVVSISQSTDSETDSESGNSNSNKNSIDTLDYWCSPSPEQLLTLSPAQLTSVSDFVIGRKGYGYITFNYDVDLTAFVQDFEGELFGKTVIFNSSKTVEVYPHSETKPNLGYGMNVPATITLEGVYPIDKKTKQPLMNCSDMLEIQYFVKKLRSMNEMEFISYNPFGGIWTFKVNHFSIWGLINEEDAEIDEELLNQYKEKHSQLEHEKEQQNDAIANVISQTNKETEKVSTEDLIIAVDQPDSIIDMKQYEPDVTESDFVFIESEPKLSTSDNWVEQLKLAGSSLQSVFISDKYGGQTKADDINLLVSDFNKDLEQQRKIIEEKKLTEKYMAVNFSITTKVLYSRKTDVSIKSLSLGMQKDSKIIKGVFEKQLELASLKNRATNGFPIIAKSSVKFSDILNILDNKSEEYKLWELCSILFDPLTLEYEVKNEIKEEILLKKKRHQLLSSWLTSSISEEINFKLKNTTDPLDKIFLYLMLNDVITATKIAIDSNNGHLAVILSFLDSNEPYVKDLASSQLSKWNSSIPKANSKIMRIYQLLSDGLLENQKLIKSLLDEFSWLSIFGIQTFYSTIDEHSLEEIVSFNIGSFPDTPSDELSYKILSLFGAVDSTEEIFKKSHLKKSAFDVQFAWFFVQIIRYNNHRSFNEIISDKITLDFIEQMKIMNLPEEALYGMCFICDDKVAEQQIELLVLTYIEQLYFKNEGKIFEKLNIPEKLVNYALSLHYKYQSKFSLEVEYLLKGGYHKEAKEVIITEVGPNLIMDYLSNNNDIKYLQELDGLIKIFPKNEIDDWSCTLGVFENYLNIFLHRVSKNLIEKNIDSLINGLSIIIKNYQNHKKLMVSCNYISKKVMDKVLSDKLPKELNAGMRAQLLNLPLCGPEKYYFTRLFSELSS